MPQHLGAWTNDTRFGPQPVIGVLNQRRMTVSRLAAALGVSYARLIKVVHGAIAPVPREVNKIAAELGAMPRDLFTDEARYAGGDDV